MRYTGAQSDRDESPTGASASRLTCRRNNVGLEADAPGASVRSDGALSALVGKRSEDFAFLCYWRGVGGPSALRKLFSVGAPMMATSDSRRAVFARATAMRAFSLKPVLRGRIPGNPGSGHRKAEPARDARAFGGPRRRQYDKACGGHRGRAVSAGCGDLRTMRRRSRRERRRSPSARVRQRHQHVRVPGDVEAQRLVDIDLARLHVEAAGVDSQ